MVQVTVKHGNTQVKEDAIEEVLAAAQAARQRGSRLGDRIVGISVYYGSSQGGKGPPRVVTMVGSCMHALRSSIVRCGETSHYTNCVQIAMAEHVYIFQGL